MKRKRLILFLLPLLLLAGCWNALDERELAHGGQAAEATTFTATIEGALTKTLLEGQPGGVRPVWWADNDSIHIGGKIYKVKSIPADSTTASFSGIGAVKQGGKYKAYYPTSIYNLSLPETQTYKAPQTLSGRKYPTIAHLPMYAETQYSDIPLNFQNICAVLNFRVTGAHRVTKVEVTSTEHVLSGAFTIAGDGTASNRWYAKMNPGGAKTVTLDCTKEPGGGVELSADTTDFFIAVPENQYKANDLTVKFYSGTTVIKTLTNHQTIDPAQRSHIFEFRGDARGSERMRFVLSTAAGRDFMLPFPTEADTKTDLLIDWGDGTAPTLIPKGTILTDAVKTYTYQTAATCTLTITSLEAENYQGYRITKFGFARYVGTPSTLAALPGSDMLIEVLDPILKSASTDFSAAFALTTSLQKVCGNLFSKNPGIDRLANGFERSGIQEVPADLFAGITASTIGCNSLFYGTKRLRTVPQGIFDPLQGKVTGFRSAFNESNIETIPGGLFKGQSTVTDFGWTFRQSKLTNLPSDTFEGCTAVKDYGKTFEDCTSLVGPIPAGLFPSDEVMLFDRTFNNCTSLVGPIPAGLFPSTKVTTFQRTFGNCSNLTGPIPANLFPSTEVTTFRETFDNCSNLRGPIPAGLFPSTEVTTFQRTFRNCSHLTGPIPAGLFQPAGSTVLNMSELFSCCYRLEGPLPDHLFSENTGVTTFAYAFSECFSLSGPIPAHLFVDGSRSYAAESFQRLFSTFVPDDNNALNGWPLSFPDATNRGESVQDYLRSIGLDPADASSANQDAMLEATVVGISGDLPANLFWNCSAVENFDYTFYRCKHLTGGIPKNLFAGKSRAETFYRCFYNCTGLNGIIEPGLFDGCTSASNFNSTFTECRLTGNLPAGLFKDTRGTNFYRLFWGNKFEGDIPADLFGANCVGGGINRDFFGVFAYCTELGKNATGVIPSTLFSPCTAAKDFSFAFLACRNLKKIGSGLFDNCRDVVNFGGTFAETGLTGSDAIPANLFNAAGAKVTEFYFTWGTHHRGVFDKCTNLTAVPANIFAQNLNANIQYAFYGCTGLTSLPALWNTHASKAHDGCFYNCTAATNYSDVSTLDGGKWVEIKPVGWHDR